MSRTIKHVDQLPLFTPEATWKPVDPSNWPDFRSHAKIIGVDTETHDPGLLANGPGFIRGDAFVCGISLASEDGRKIYLPIQHSEDNYDRDKVISYVKHQLGGDQPKCGANLMYDLESLWSLGIEVKGPLLDVQILEPLIDEEPEFGYSLQALSKKYLNTTKNESLLDEAAAAYSVTSKGGMKYLPARFVAPYAEDDALLPIQIYQKQWPVIEEENLNVIFGVEQELQRVLFKMRLKGVRIDIDRANRAKNEIIDQEKLLENKLRLEFGRPFSFESSEDLAAILGDSITKAGFYIPRTAAGNHSITNEWLQEVGIFVPAAAELYKLRKMTKMRRDFIDKLIEDSVHGRIYTNWRQMRSYSDKGDSEGTRSGRIASSNFNLTQVPSRDPYWGPLIRSLFIADEGKQWVKADYSQQEPRIMLHFSYVMKYDGAYAAVQRYRDDPSTDYHQLVADLIKEKTGRDIGRRPAKDINLGSAYGMGVPKLAAKLGVDLDTARDILSAYHAGIPYAKQMERDCMDLAERRGYVKTILGRRRRFNLWEPTHYDKFGGVKPIRDQAKAQELWGSIRRAFCHKSLNSVVQGSAADQMKKAIVELDRRGYTPQIQVYDELNGSYEPGDYKIVKEVMENAIPMEVPFLVDPEVGTSWGELSDP
jgi:DNA polymerase I-like protein with 3'-5' exonuclease and polymerase domains